MTNGLRLLRALFTRRLWRVEVDGRSMFPALLPGQIVWCEARPRVRDLRVGDIVVVGRESLSDPRRLSPGDAELSIKRLSALPDHADPSTGRPAPSSGFCEVLGDNAAHSADSRHFGPIPLRCVLARVLLPIAPQKSRSEGLPQPHPAEIRAEPR